MVYSWDYNNHEFDSSACKINVFNQSPIKVADVTKLTKPKDLVFFNYESVEGAEAIFTNGKDDLFFSLITPSQSDMQVNSLLSQSDCSKKTGNDKTLCEEEKADAIPDDRIGFLRTNILMNKDKAPTLLSGPCTAINIKIKGEHQISDQPNDLELQIKCDTVKVYQGNDLKYPSYIAIPVQITKEKEEESKVFSGFEKDQIKIGGKVTLNGFNEVLSPFVLTQGVVFYLGTNNVPPCGLMPWIVITQPLKILEEKHTALKKIVTDNKNSVTGNYRNAHDPSKIPSVERGVYYVNFSKYS